MKKIVLFVLFALCTSMAGAQDPYVPKADKYRVEYHENNYLRQKGQNLYFVKLKAEWPECLNYSTLEPLHRYITKTVFEREDNSFDNALNHYLDSLGAPLEQVPDAGNYKSYYITINVTELEYDADRYMSMRLMRCIWPKDTTELINTTQRLITYDLIHDKVLSISDLVKCMSKYGDEDARWRLTREILLYNPHDIAPTYVDLLPSEACLMRLGTVFDIPGTANWDELNALTIVPEKSMKSYLTKAAKKLLVDPVPVRTAPVKPFVKNFGNEPVYTLVDAMPTVMGFEPASPEMLRYMVNNVRYPSFEEMLQIGGRVVVQFIVEKDGSISSPSVLMPVSPGLDREAIRFVTQMPTWKPGQLNGQPVRVLVNLPITFKMQ